MTRPGYQTAADSDDEEDEDEFLTPDSSPGTPVDPIKWSMQQTTFSSSNRVSSSTGPQSWSAGGGVQTSPPPPPPVLLVSSPTCVPVNDTSGSKKSVSSVLESKLLEKVYDRYQVSLSDMQVIVGRVKDNWKHAHLRGSSQVWSQIQYYSVDFSQSRIRVKSAFSTNAQSRFATVDAVLGPPRLARHP